MRWAVAMFPLRMSERMGLPEKRVFPFPLSRFAGEGGERSEPGEGSGEGPGLPPDASEAKGGGNPTHTFAAIFPINPLLIPPTASDS